MNAYLRRAEAEIKAWVVAGTPADEARDGLNEAYRERSGREKSAFIAALIDRLVDQTCASSNAGSAKPSA